MGGSPTSPVLLSRHSAPDLSDLFNKSMLNVILDSLIGNTPKLANYVDFGLWTNLVRLTDKSLNEYNYARNELQTYIDRESNNIFSPLFRSVDHFENSVTSTYRAIQMAEGLRSSGIGPSHLLPTGRQREMLRVFRNHIEHTNDKLIKRQIAEGDPVFTEVGETGIYIGNKKLPYKDLASCIKKCHTLVEHIRASSI
jgi:hypothetical protein